MPATKRLVLDLPADQVDLIEARVAGGEYESPSALVLDLLAADAEPPTLYAKAQAAFDRETAERFARLDAGLEKTIPAEQVFAELRAELEARLYEEERLSSCA